MGGRASNSLSAYVVLLVSPNTAKILQKMRLYTVYVYDLWLVDVSYCFMVSTYVCARKIDGCKFVCRAAECRLSVARLQTRHALFAFFPQISPKVSFTCGISYVSNWVCCLDGAVSYITVLFRCSCRFLFATISRPPRDRDVGPRPHPYKLRYIA